MRIDRSLLNWGVFLIALGGIPLAVDQGWLESDIAGDLGQLWPLILVGIGLVGITFWENGFKHFTANHPLRKPEDFAGHRFRVMKSRLLMEQFKMLGSTAVPIDFHATWQALADATATGRVPAALSVFGGTGRAAAAPIPADNQPSVQAE